MLELFAGGAIRRPSSLFAAVDAKAGPSRLPVGHFRQSANRQDGSPDPGALWGVISHKRLSARSSWASSVRIADGTTPHNSGDAKVHPGSPGNQASNRPIVWSAIDEWPDLFACLLYGANHLGQAIAIEGVPIAEPPPNRNHTWTRTSATASRLPCAAIRIASDRPKPTKRSIPCWPRGQLGLPCSRVLAAALRQLTLPT